jgi:hypothetical protein
MLSSHDDNYIDMHGLAKYLEANQTATKQLGRTKILVRPALVQNQTRP